MHLCRLVSLGLLWSLILGGASGTVAATRVGPPRSLPPALRAGGQAYEPGIIVIKFAQPLTHKATRSASGLPQIDALFSRYGVEQLRPVAPPSRAQQKVGATNLSRIYTLRYSIDEDALQVARAFDEQSDIEYAEPLFVYELAYTPNDPLLSVQASYFANMQLEAAYDLHHNSSAVVIAVVDGGTQWDHEDLLANVWTNPGETLDGTDTDGNGFIDDIRGWNFANGTNDPTGLPQTPSNADHGTHVAGIACAVLDNNTGIAGASANAQFMGVCVSHPTIDRAISFGYSGIIYAVDNGADIINCSWGGQGNPSSFEQDIIDYAWQNDVVIIAAAGNNANNQPHYPSSYEHVLSIANVNDSDVRSSSSNYGPDIDVSAPGQSILAPIDSPTGDDYGYKTGTSMASPHAAALAALVKVQHPGYNADQVAQRVRVTADNIDLQNPSYVGQLGLGRINALQALSMTTPAITITQSSWTTTNGDQVLEPGETVSLTLQVTNHLDSASAVSFTLTDDSPNITITSGVAAAPSLATLQSLQLPVMTFDIDPTTPIQHVVTFTLAVSSTAPAYSDASRFRMVVLPVTATHAANKIATTITSVGKLGFGLGLGGTGSDGIGFSYNGGANLMFEGSMIMGTSAASLASAARGAGGVLDDDFVTAPGGTPAIAASINNYDEFGVASFTDAAATAPMNLFIRQESWEMIAAPDDDYITLSYSIRNDGTSTLDNFHVGWFFDWDIDGGSYGTNQTAYDAARGLGYAWDSGAGPDTYVGVRVLTAPGTTSYRGIWNDSAHPDNPSWGIYDDYTDVEKWESISGGTAQPNAGPADVSNSIGTGPFQIPPGDSIQVAFAIVAADDLVSLQSHSDAALGLWNNPPSASPEEIVLPRRFLLAQNVPNPFNPQTLIRFDLPRQAIVRLQIFDVRGRRVHTLINGPVDAGSTQVQWNGRDDFGAPLASGTYFYQLTFAGKSFTRKMQLLK